MLAFKVYQKMMLYNEKIIFHFSFFLHMYRIASMCGDIVIIIFF